jgi:hypothetical protein
VREGERGESEKGERVREGEEDKEDERRMPLDNQLTLLMK